jgi:hypothetical protein
MTKRSFAAVPDFINKMAAEAPGGREVVAPTQVESPQQTELKAPEVRQEARPVFRERDATQKMTVNMPKGLYEELRAYMKLTDIPMSDVIVEGARRELARLKKQEG